MAMTKPIITEIAYKTWMINELGVNSMYVLEGADRSLVVDAGTGLCNFRGIVETLTDKPYDVVITHAHGDHVGAMHQFDRIYIHKDAVVGNEERWEQSTKTEGFSGGGFNMVQRQHVGNWDIWECPPEIWNRGSCDTEVVYIDEGKQFDLGGGRVVTTYCLPGHAPGHLYFVDSGARIAFTGDCVNNNNGVTDSHAASTHIRYMLKLYNDHGKTYDRIFTGHCNYGGRLDVLSYNINVLKNLIECYRAYLRGEVEGSEMPRHTRPEEMRKIIFYGSEVQPGPLAKDPKVMPDTPSKLWEDGEEHIVP